MKKNSKAFTLIKNLDMSEKRYFKLFAERHATENKSIILFEIIDSISTENDAEIKQLLAERNVSAAFLAADKNYLYNQILRSLQGFHHKKSLTIYQIEKLLQIELLYEKGLYDLCIYEAESTLKIAEKKEDFSLKIELLTWLRKAVGYSKGLMSAYQINQMIKHNNDLMANQIAYTDLYYESLKIKFGGFKARDIKQIAQFKKLFQNPLLKDVKNAKSLLAKLRYYLIYANYYYVINDAKKEKEHLKITLQLMEHSEYYHVENPFDYIYVFNFYLNLLKNDNTTIFYKELSRFKNFSDAVKISKEKSEMQIFHFSALVELNMKIERGLYKDCLEIIPAIEAKLKKFADRIEPAIQINLFYLFAYAYFKTSQHRKALLIANHIINNYQENDKEDIYNLSKVFLLILHYELNHSDLLEYLVPRTIKDLKKKGKLYQTEMLVLNVLQKTHSVTTYNKARNFVKLREKLLDLKSTKFEATANTLFDFEDWCSQKIMQFKD